MAAKFPEDAPSFPPENKPLNEEASVTNNAATESSNTREQRQSNEHEDPKEGPSAGPVVRNFPPSLDAIVSDPAPEDSDYDPELDPEIYPPPRGPFPEDETERQYHSFCYMAHLWCESYRRGFTFATMALFIGCCQSLQAPLMGQLIHRNNISPMRYSLIILAFEGVTLVFGFIFGTDIFFWHPKLSLATGIALMGGSNAIYGFLPWCIHDQCLEGWTFIWVASLIRAVEGIGRAIFLTATISYLFSTYGVRFPQLSIVIGLGFFGGFVIGPAISCAIVRFIGFSYPFYVFGFMLVCSAGFVSKLPMLHNISLGRCHIKALPHGLCDTLFHLCIMPSIFTCFWSMFSSAISYAFLMITMEPHFSFANETFEMKGFWMAIFFLSHGVLALIGGGLSLIMTLKVGEKYPEKYVYVIGSFLIIACVLLLNVEKELHYGWWLQIVAVGLHGLGSSNSIMAFQDFIGIGIRLSFSENTATYRTIAFLCLSITCLGTICGSVLTGHLLEKYGFMKASYLPVGFHIVSIFLSIAVGIGERFKCFPDKTSIDYLAEVKRPALPRLHTYERLYGMDEPEGFRPSLLLNVLYQIAETVITICKYLASSRRRVPDSPLLADVNVGRIWWNECRNVTEEASMDSLDDLEFGGSMDKSFRDMRGSFSSPEKREKVRTRILRPDELDVTPSRAREPPRASFRIADDDDLEESIQKLRSSSSEEAVIKGPSRQTSPVSSDKETTTSEGSDAYGAQSAQGAISKR